nr:MAG TPA: hypothetical protein [Caudoviricetes sp.]
MTSSSILPQALANLHHQSSRSHAPMQARLCCQSMMRCLYFIKSPNFVEVLQQNMSCVP